MMQACQELAAHPWEAPGAMLSGAIAVFRDTVCRCLGVLRGNYRLLEVVPGPSDRSLRGVKAQIEPAGVTAGKSFSGSNTLLKKFVREYIATSATISMTFASV